MPFDTHQDFVLPVLRALYGLKLKFQPEHVGGYRDPYRVPPPVPPPPPWYVASIKSMREAGASVIDFFRHHKVVTETGEKCTNAK